MALSWISFDLTDKKAADVRTNGKVQAVRSEDQQHVRESIVGMATVYNLEVLSSFLLLTTIFLNTLRNIEVKNKKMQIININRFGYSFVKIPLHR